MDHLTPARRFENVHRIRHKNMKPEMTVRCLVHRMNAPSLFKGWDFTQTDLQPYR